MTFAVLYRFTRWGVLVGAALLAACATPHKIDEPLSVRQGEESSLLSRAGRFALNVTHAGGRMEAVQGGFAWRDDGRQLVLDLSNPLGSTLARIWVGPGQAVLERSDGSRESAPDPDALVEQVLGSPIPVAGLRDWLRGRPAAGAPPSAEQADEQGRPMAFQQSGWRVTLSRYDEHGPRLLQLNRHEAQRSISARLIVDQ